MPVIRPGVSRGAAEVRERLPSLCFLLFFVHFIEYAIYIAVQNVPMERLSAPNQQQRQQQHQQQQQARQYQRLRSRSQ